MAPSEVRCPECGGTDVTFDWLYVVVSARFEGDALQYVTVGGFTEVPPDVVGTCAGCQAEGVAVRGDLGRVVAEVVATTDPRTADGITLYEVPR